MRFLRVDALAFGPFNDKCLEFAPGMNVFSGPNESGKSSWLAAIYAALCGRRRGRGGAKGDQEFERLHKPWEGGSWEVVGLVEMDDGGRIEFRHELNDRVRCAATNIITGEDLSASLMNDGTPDGSKLLGLNRQIMRPTLFVGQADILAVREGAGSLQEFMQRAASAGGGDATARRALDALARFEENSIGGERARIKPLPAARAARERTAAELAEARDRQAEYQQHLGEFDETLDRVRFLEAERLGADARLTRAELAGLEERLRKLRPLAAEFASGPPPEPAEQNHTAAEVTQALAEWRATPALGTPLEGPSAADLEAELAGLPEAPPGDLSPALEVEETYRALSEARHELQAFRERESPEPGLRVVEGTTPNELRELAGALERQAGTSKSAKRVSRLPGILAAAGLGLGLLGAVLLVVGPAVAGAILLAVGAPAALAGGLLVFIRREVSSQLPAEADAEAASRRLRQLGLLADPAELRRLAYEQDRALGAAAESERRAVRLQQLETRLADSIVAFADVLAQRGEGSPADHPDGAYNRYREACRERQAQATLADRRPLLQQQLVLRRRQEEQHKAAALRLQDAETRLRSAARTAGLSADGAADEVAARLERWSEAAAQRAKADLAAWQRYQELQGLLDGSQVGDWEAKAAALRQRLAALEDAVEVSADSARSPEEIDVELREVRDQSNELKGRLGNMKAGLPDLAALEEAADRAEREVERLESLASVVRKTRTYLSRAQDQVHRTIAPKLKAAIESRLSAITSGRYHEATVDPQDLTIKVRARGGELRPATALSHGTAEQIYLLLRVGLAEHLVTSGESAPLILDDVTIQSDANRSIAILELLHELSKERQIIFFSQEEDVAMWSETNLLPPTDRFQRLEVLEAR